MFSVVAILIYLAALAVPSWLLYRFGSSAWYWHALAIAAGLVLGLIPTPAALVNPACEMATGVVFVFLMVWGIGGLAMIGAHRPRHEKHA